jgi:GT2 family glycosyltransferase
VHLEVIVIDNASYDGSEPMIVSEFPQVTFIQGDENVGFARANNAAAAIATGRNLLFLNPDTEVTEGAIERMVRFIDATPDAGAVGCRLLNTDGSLQTSCIQAYPTISNQILDAELLRRLFPRASLWGTRAFLACPSIPARAEGISGACILVEREAFLQVSQFTTAYFMYAEDVDLCYKLERIGRRNYYLGDVSVIHHGGQSSGASTESQFGNVMMRESLAKFFQIHHGPAYAHTYRAALAISALARLAALSLSHVISLGCYRSSAIKSGLRKWVKVLRWTVGAERWVRNHGARSS